MKKKTTNDYFVPIKGIENGAIVLENNSKVTGVKVMPKNIFILDTEVEYMTIRNLKNVYNQLDCEFWMISADRPVDINVYLSELQVLYNKVQDPAKRKLIMEDINKGNMFMNNNVVDTEYYILFKDKKDDIINKRIRDLINSLASAGLTSHKVTNEDLRIILDNFLNGGKSTTFGTVMSSGY